jgi:hypothetical protein
LVEGKIVLTSGDSIVVSGMINNGFDIMLSIAEGV